MVPDELSDDWLVIKDEGATFYIAAEWQEEDKIIKVHYKMSIDDWKKRTSPDTKINVKGNESYQAQVSSYKFFGQEECWGASYDYGAVYFRLKFDIIESATNQIIPCQMSCLDSSVKIKNGWFDFDNPGFSLNLTFHLKLASFTIV